jgi:GH24 family phage-related lysozyme (muramidase)
MAPHPSRKAAAAAAIAVALAAPMEGLRQVAYYDPPGILTVCYGTTGADVQKGRLYSIDECKALLNRDMLKAVEEVDRCVPKAPPMVLAAFSDAAYNLGSKVACDTRSSGAARKLQAGDWAGACLELLKWDKARIAGVLVALPGLTKRRAAEMQLCMKGFT